MAYFNPMDNKEPVEVSFEVRENDRIKEYISKSFIRTIILTKEDVRRGIIEVQGVIYNLYVSTDLNNIIYTKKFTRIPVIVSFQHHTNDATIALCKLIENTNKRNQKFIKAKSKEERLVKLNKLFNLYNFTTMKERI